MTEIFENYEVKGECTFKIGGRLKKAAFPDNLSDFTELIKSKEYDMVLGNCSNVLFCSDFIDKKIIFTKKLKEYEIYNEKVTAQCGVKGPFLSKECANHSLSGFEFLIGFPGSIGGMIYMNASAHNQSISDTFISANVYDVNSDKIFELKKDNMNFGYRKSVLQNNHLIVLNAEFHLITENKEKIEELMKRNIEFRRQRHPSLSTGNAGSIFKNPQNDSAGRLLDLCGMRGEKEGGACIFENHANFILNKENATSSDVINLMYKMYTKVKDKYTIQLKPEIIYIGNQGTKEHQLWEQMK